MNLPFFYEPFSLVPFDRTYDEVTSLLKAAATALPATEEPWLTTLNEKVDCERRSWDEDTKYLEYFHSCKDLRLRVLHLVAGAYLHISYDLPRVIADNWPGHDPSKPVPSEARGEEIFLALDPIIPLALETTIRDRTVFGLITRIKWLVRGSALQIASQWALRLRTAAWIHARRLAVEPHLRRSRETQMMRAITKALEHVKPWKIWRIGLLVPPTLSTRTGLLAVLPLSLAQFSYVWILMLILLVGAIAWSFLREYLLRSFIDNFGRRVYYYMNAATDFTREQDFEAYLQRAERGEPYY